MTKEERLKKMESTAKEVSNLLTHSGLSPADCYRIAKQTEKMILGSILDSIDLTCYGQEGLFRKEDTE
jgi:hypothetical protein